MSVAEEDIRRLDQELAALREEMSRLESLGAALAGELNAAPAPPVPASKEELPREALAALEAAQKRAAEAGAIRAEQFRQSMTKTPKASGGRRAGSLRP